MPLKYSLHNVSPFYRKKKTNTRAEMQNISRHISYDFKAMNLYEKLKDQNSYPPRMFAPPLIYIM